MHRISYHQRKKMILLIIYWFWALWRRFPRSSTCRQPWSVVLALERACGKAVWLGFACVTKVTPALFVVDDNGEQLSLLFRWSAWSSGNREFVCSRCSVTSVHVSNVFCNTYQSWWASCVKLWFLNACLFRSSHSTCRQHGSLRTTTEFCSAWILLVPTKFVSSGESTPIFGTCARNRVHVWSSSAQWWWLLAKHAKSGHWIRAAAGRVRLYIIFWPHKLKRY